ncbi:MAG: alpha/beta hydrolase [Eubacteriales bacterium]
MKRKLFSLISVILSFIFICNAVGCGKESETTKLPYETTSSENISQTYETIATTASAALTSAVTETSKTTASTATSRTRRTTGTKQTTTSITREPGTLLPAKELSEKKIAAHEHIELWRFAEVPYNENIYEPKTPTIVPFIVEGSDEAVIIFPGGGYFQVTAGPEGEDIAKAYNEKGISAFVVNYRCSSKKIYDKNAILADAQRAVQLVRYYSDVFGIDKNKIAVCGFSAGGHLAMMLCAHEPETNLGYDVIGEESSVPNALILGYPVTTLGDGTYYTMPELFLGADYKNNELIEKYSYGYCVSSMPATYIFYSLRDGMVNYTKNSVALADALKAAGRTVEVSAFSDGSHGVGLGKGYAEFSTWLQKSVDFLGKTFGK